MQNRGVHQNNVGHGDKRRHARHNLGPPSGAKLTKLEVFFCSANQDLFTIADVPKQDSQTVIARCRELAAISDMEGGTFRQFLSPAAKRCQDVVAGWMKAAGMAVRLDAVGNLRAVLPGSQGKHIFLMGSHLDTVRNSGAFDGILGVVLAIALVENLDRQLPFGLEVIGFSEEEGVRFSRPCIGSGALVGRLDHSLVELITPVLRDFALDPAGIPDAKITEDYFGYLEFHIEQGPVLDLANESVALVEAISGQLRSMVTFSGSANHAGTTPMSLRKDALTAAARWIIQVEDIARSTPHLVATVGKLEVQPNISNVIPGSVTASLDVRHPDDHIRRQAFERCRQAAPDATWTNPVSVNTIPMDAALTRRLEEACPEGTRRMISGAGHDAMILAPHLPSAMLFLRSPGGISHHPAEDVRPQDVDLALSIGQRFLESLTI